MMFIFLLQFLMKNLDQLTGKGLSAAIIVELITLNLAWMLVLAVPMGVLVATLMAFGGLASTNEITAMRASGVSLYKISFAFCSSASIMMSCRMPIIARRF
jgi:lipopolysaccharide export system permease protein